MNRVSAGGRQCRVNALATLLLLPLLLLASCHVHSHRFGGGPTGVGQESARQFYLFFGWLPLNDVDVQRLTADLSSYEVRTESSFVDYLLFPLLLPLTMSSRTVTVYR